MHRVRLSFNLMVLGFLDLSPEQQKALIDIRRKRTQLLLEIQVGIHHLLFQKNNVI